MKKKKKKKKRFCFVGVVGMSDSGWFYCWRRCHEDNWNAYSEKLACVIEASEASVFEYWHLFNLNPSTDKKVVLTKHVFCGCFI